VGGFFVRDLRKVVVLALCYFWMDPCKMFVQPFKKLTPFSAFLYLTKSTIRLAYAFNLLSMKKQTKRALAEGTGGC